MISTSGGTILFGGKVDRNKRFVENTVILNPKLESQLMREEIFGPIMPIFPFKTIDEVISQINQLDKALCIYYFGNPNSSNLKAVIDQTSSGGVSANELVVQSASNSLGFGGVGASGYGRYVGEIGFEHFSNRKTILLKSAYTPNFVLDILTPPFKYRKLIAAVMPLTLEMTKSELKKKVLVPLALLGVGLSLKSRGAKL